MAETRKALRFRLIFLVETILAQRLFVCKVIIMTRLGFLKERLRQYYEAEQKILNSA